MFSFYRSRICKMHGLLQKLLRPVHTKNNNYKDNYNDDSINTRSCSVDYMREHRTDLVVCHFKFPSKFRLAVNFIVHQQQNLNSESDLNSLPLQLWRGVDFTMEARFPLNKNKKR